MPNLSYTHLLSVREFGKVVFSHLKMKRMKFGETNLETCPVSPSLQVLKRSNPGQNSARSTSLVEASRLGENDRYLKQKRNDLEADQGFPDC